MHLDLYLHKIGEGLLEILARRRRILRWKARRKMMNFADMKRRSSFGPIDTGTESPASRFSSKSFPMVLLLPLLSEERKVLTHLVAYVAYPQRPTEAR